MTATKHKPKGRKGLLPPVVAAAPKAKQQKQTSPSSTPNGIKNGAIKAAASTPPSHLSSTAAKPSKAAKIDKHTGKKKGTLFSSAPSPSKASGSWLRAFQAKSAANSAPKQQSDSSDAQIAVAKVGTLSIAKGVHANNKGAHGNSKKPSKSSQAGANVNTQPGSSTKKRKWGKGKGPRAAPAAETEAETASPSNKGATGKSNWDRLKVQALEQSEALPPKPQHTHCTANTDKKRRRAELAQKAGDKSSEWLAASSHGIVQGKLVPKSEDASATEVLALDCEMVGVGTSQGRKRDALARAALVCTSSCSTSSSFSVFSQCRKQCRLLESCGRYSVSAVSFAGFCLVLVFSSVNTVNTHYPLLQCPAML